MRLSRAQAAVVTVLNLIIAGLIAFMIFYSSGTGNTASGAGAGDGGTNAGGEPSGSVQPPPDVPEHIKLRPASAGAVPEVVRETRLMGSGDESVVAVHFSGDNVLIFGNATVADYDFDSYGGFLCVVGGDGGIRSFGYFGGAMNAVGVIAGGYAVAAGNKLYFVDGEGSITEKVQTDGPALDILCHSETTAAVVTQPSTTSLKLCEYSLNAVGEWTVGRSTRIDSAYSLKFFDCYDFGDSYVISARAYSLPRYDSAVFYSLRAGGDAQAHYYGGTGENITRPYAVMPCAAGYFALTAKNGLATLITVDNAFVSYHSVSLGFAFSDARLFFSGGKYYACFERTDGAVTYELDGELSRRTVTALYGISVDCVGAGNSGIVAAGYVAEKTVGAVSETACITEPFGTLDVTLPVRSAVFYCCKYSGDGLLVVLSATGGEALSAPTAGRDIYVITVATESGK